VLRRVALREGSDVVVPRHRADADVGHLWRSTKSCAKFCATHGVTMRTVAASAMASIRAKHETFSIGLLENHTYIPGPIFICAEYFFHRYKWWHLYPAEPPPDINVVTFIPDRKPTRYILPHAQPPLLYWALTRSLFPTQAAQLGAARAGGHAARSHASRGHAAGGRCGARPWRVREAPDWRARIPHLYRGVTLPSINNCHLYRVFHPVQMRLLICTNGFVPALYPVQMRVWSRYKCHFFP
jgi:hypothetical protein